MLRYSADKNDYRVQMLQNLGSPLYFSYHRRNIPCEILEVYSKKVRVAFRDERGRPLESWEKLLDVVNATRFMRNQEDKN